MKFDVFLPSLLVSPDWFAESAPPRLPAIEALLARGVMSTTELWPAALFSADNVAHSGHARAIASFAALGDGIETGAQGWMFAEPVHFQADRDALNLFPSSHLNITAGEAALLIEALNTNFADRGLLFSFGTSGNWYVCCSVDELPQTTSIRAAQRGTIFEKLPKSRGTLNWKAIQNEAQMLFHSHAVNDTREAAGQMTINGLWFWGEGILPPPPTGLKPSIDAVFGDTPLAKGLARWVGAPFASLSELAIADAVLHANHNLLVISALERFHERGDIKESLQIARQLEVQIFAPLLAALRDGTIDELVLTLPRNRDSLVVRVDAKSFRGLTSWWKSMTQRPRSFLASSLA